MDIQAIKIDLIQWLTGVDDVVTLKKLQAVKQLQESVLSDVHKALLEERMASYESDPKNVVDWEIVMKELEKEF